MKHLYLICGTMGVGKTAVCQELKKVMPNSVFLDGDWCWDASPFQVTEKTKAMVMDNICHVLNNFLHCSAYENVIFCWVMHQKTILQEILEKLDTENCEVICISLTVNEKNLRERLAKDINCGIRSSDVIERSIAKLAMYPLPETVSIDTSDASVSMVAARILALN